MACLRQPGVEVPGTVAAVTARVEKESTDGLAGKTHPARPCHAQPLWAALDILTVQAVSKAPVSKPVCILSWSKDDVSKNDTRQPWSGEAAFKSVR